MIVYVPTEFQKEKPDILVNVYSCQYMDNHPMSGHLWFTRSDWYLGSIKADSVKNFIWLKPVELDELNREARG